MGQGSTASFSRARKASVLALSFLLAFGAPLGGLSAYASETSAGGGASQSIGSTENLNPDIGKLGSESNSDRFRQLTGSASAFSESHSESSSKLVDQTAVDVHLTAGSPKALSGEVVQDGLVYKLDGETATLVSWLGEALPDDVIIPSLVVSGGDSYTVTGIGKPDANEGVFHNASPVSLSLPESIESIADNAFSDCPSLKRIFVSSKNQQFASYDGMLFTKDLTCLLSIPEGKGGVALIPNQTAVVPVLALSHCAELSAVEVGEGNASFTSYNGLLFSQDMSMLIVCPPAAGGTVVIPAEVETIGSDAFATCEPLSITVLGNVCDINPAAFNDPAKQAVVALLAGDDYDSRRAVWEAAGFSRFNEPSVPGDVSEPSIPKSEEGVAASGFIYTLLDDYSLSVAWAGGDNPPAELVVPAAAEIDGVSYRISTIAPSAFEGRESLVSVTLPTGISSIGEAAFAGCSNLSSVQLPPDLRNIGARAFEMTALFDVWLPSSVELVGSRVFADCGALERVIALGTPEVADDAIAGCLGTTVYCPSEGISAWSVGLPAAGNHLAPYGVELAGEPIGIKAGESTNLLEGGMVESPEPIEVTYAYVAFPVSVDAGMVSGKAEGSTEVAAVLSLDGTELTRSSRQVEVSPGDEVTSDDLDIVNETAALMPVGYLTGARAAVAPISVTAPVAVTFGGEGYDVANPAASVTAPARFENKGDVAVVLAGLTCASTGVDEVLEAKTGDLAGMKLFSLYPQAELDSARLDFGFGADINNATPPALSSYLIEPSSSLDCMYRLNLTADTSLADAKVKDNVANNGMTVKPLAQVSYTFEAASFILKDTVTGATYTTAEVKAHAEDISAKGVNSPYYSKYSEYINDESRYTCKVAWGDGTTYDVRVIGINHDSKSDGSGNAGLTFQFVNLLNTMHQVNSTASNIGGWEVSSLRGSMNSGDIWNQVPVDLQGVITAVNKASHNDSGTPTDVISMTPDKLFLASYSELMGTGLSADIYPWTSKEGSQYEYWRKSPGLTKAPQSSQTPVVTWWERSVSPSSSSNFLCVGTNGNAGLNSDASYTRGICPCFCF